MTLMDQLSACFKDQESGQSVAVGRGLQKQISPKPNDKTCHMDVMFLWYNSRKSVYYTNFANLNIVHDGALRV